MGEISVEVAGEASLVANPGDLICSGSGMPFVVPERYIPAIRAALRSDSYGPEPVGPSANANADEPLRSDSPVSRKCPECGATQRPHGMDCSLWRDDLIALPEDGIYVEIYDEYRPPSGTARHGMVYAQLETKVENAGEENLPVHAMIVPVPRPQVGDPSENGDE